MKTFSFPISILISIVFVLTGCHSTRPPLNTVYPQLLNSGPDLITHSLFDSKDRTISEEDIQRLLNGRIILPDTIRIAIFKYGSTSMNRYFDYHMNDEELLKTQQNYLDTLIDQLTSSNKVSKVILIPSIMTSSFPNITQLRETAIRLQSDLLLVFSITSDIYYKYKVFQRNEAKAFATCETILMDTRTGVVPFSNVITKENHIEKIPEDFNPNETRKRAENGAVLLSISESGKSVVEFLGN